VTSSSFTLRGDRPDVKVLRRQASRGLIVVAVRPLSTNHSTGGCAMGLDLHNSLIILKGVLTARLSQPDSARHASEYIPGGHGREGGG
jgi:hypothetical protein